MVLSLLGDALWIISLSIMASTTRGAWGRIDPETKVPIVADIVAAYERSDEAKAAQQGGRRG